MSCGAGVSFKRCPELCSCQLEQLESFNHATSLQVPRIGIAVSCPMSKQQRLLRTGPRAIVLPGMQVQSALGEYCQQPASQTSQVPWDSSGVRPICGPPSCVSAPVGRGGVVKARRGVLSPSNLSMPKVGVPLVAWQVRIAASRSGCVESGFCIPLFRSASRGSEHF